MVNTKNIITFDKSSLPFLCEALKIPYDPNIIAFTKEGAVTNILDLLEKEGDRRDND